MKALFQLRLQRTEAVEAESWPCVPVFEKGMWETEGQKLKNIYKVLLHPTLAFW